MYLETTEIAYDTCQLVAQTTEKHNSMEYQSPGPVPLGPGSAYKSCYFSWKYPSAGDSYGKGMAGNFVPFQYDDETRLILYHTYTEKKFPDQALHDIYSRKIVNANDDVYRLSGKRGRSVYLGIPFHGLSVLRNVCVDGHEI